MIRNLAAGALFVLFASSMAMTGEQTPRPHPAVRALGYYIVVRATINGSKQVDLFGASNLPPGAILTVDISDYIGTGSRTLSVDTNVAVGENGLFRAPIHPKNGEQFRTNIVCMVEFQPTYPAQPPDVIIAVGKMGERLGDWRKNPQIEGSPRVRTLVAMTVVR
jgi:hypothetical protein